MSKTHPSKSQTNTTSSPAKKAAGKAVAKKTAAKSVKKVTVKIPAKKAPAETVATQKPTKTAIMSNQSKAVIPKKASAVPAASTQAKKTVSPKKTVSISKKASASPKKATSVPSATPPKATVKVTVKAAAAAPVKQAVSALSKKASLVKAAPPAPVPAPKVEEEEVDLTPRVPVISSEKPEATATGALFYDSHMHTPLCKHAWGDPEEYAAQAVKSGLKGIIFTCHCPMPEGFWPSVRMSNSEFDTYVSMIQRTADAYRGRLDVCLGLESEFFPGQEKWIARLHQRADFDYILGAVHWQSKEYLAKFESGTIENFRRIYFEHLAQSAESGLYDCVAHPDLVKNYHPDSWCFAIIKKNVNSALDRIAATGVAMELNTSGLNKSYAEMNPGNEMLRMMAERKIPVVLGSDSHKAMRVGEHFITALNNLGEAGYEEVSYFKKRERVDLKISDVLASIRKAIDHNS